MAELGRHNRYTQIALHPLTPVETITLANNLMKISGLPDPLRVHLLERTDGNPFFVEEVMHALIDNGLVLSQVDANWFKFAIGFLTILAVVANSWLGKRAKAIKVET